MKNTDSAGRAYWVGKPGESLPLDPVEDDKVVTGRNRRPPKKEKAMLTEFQRMQLIGEEFPLPLVAPVVIAKVDAVALAIE